MPFVGRGLFARARALPVQVCLSLSLALAWPATAQAPGGDVGLSSLYTDLNLANCELMETRQEGNYSRYKCAGLDGIAVDVRRFDDRMMVSYQAPACPAAPQTFISFNEAGSKNEWRLRGGRPFAAILRFNVSGNGSLNIARSWLVVSKIISGRSCPIAYIAGDRPEANTIARQVADSYADRDFECGVDAPRIMSARPIALAQLVMNAFCSSKELPLGEDVEFFEKQEDRHAVETLEETRVCLKEAAKGFVSPEEDRALVANTIAKWCGADLANVIKSNRRTSQRAYEIIRVLAHREIDRLFFNQSPVPTSRSPAIPR